MYIEGFEIHICSIIFFDYDSDLPYCSHPNLKERLKTNCGNIKIVWMEINDINNSGSLGLMEFVRHSLVEINLKDLKSNVALIIKDFIIMALRGKSDWAIGCVDSNNTYELDIRTTAFFTQSYKYFMFSLSNYVKFSKCP